MAKKRTSTSSIVPIIEPIFDDIENHLIKYIASAKKSIKIAVAWFTNEEIFSSLLSTLKRGVPVTLITLYDRINVDGGIDFQELVNAGGELYLSAYNNGIVHHKYCIIDGVYVLSGSYNYTYYAEYINYENLLTIKSESVASKYAENFENVIQNAEKVKDYVQFKMEHKICRDTFAAARINTIDKHQKISNSDDALSLSEQILDCDNNISFNDFVIYDPIYKMWQKGYIIEKITYLNGELIIRFVIRTNGGCFICSQNTSFGWKLESLTDKKVYKASKLTDITINNQVVIKKAKARTIYYLEETDSELSNIKNHPVDANGRMVDSTGKPYNVERIQIPKRYTLKVNICFKIKELKSSNYSLYEGDSSCRTLQNFWHALNINLILNREKCIED